jgi:hypothetical protein
MPLQIRVLIGGPRCGHLVEPKKEAERKVGAKKQRRR